MTCSDNQQHHVSFRPDTKGTDRSAATFDSTRSGTSEESSGSTSHSSKYSKLRSSLTREQLNRDPLFFYQVTRHLGDGSMGDVKLVKKRPNRVGGSARRDIQQAVRRQKREQECLKLPVIGNLFKFCLEGDLKDDAVTDPSSHHSRFSSFLSVSDDRSVSTHAARSFEDSLLTGDPSSIASKNDNIYAMKSILLQQVARQDFIDELRNEIAILKDLDHPNIVRAIETFEFKGKISIVMEVCSGGDLYARDPYSEAEAARIVGSILSAIAYMHSRNVVHRDLKFENCLFVNTSPMSPVKLIDFGLSKVYVGKKLTDISGTICTMAPEVMRGQHTEKADMWSIGVMAYMLLASALPFYGKNREQVVKKILKNRYSFKGKSWKRVSPEAKEFISSLLVLDPNQRADAESALGSAWLKLQSATPTSTTSTPRAEEEEMARSAMLKYAQYPKLKKMALMVVAHKSSSEEIGVLRKLFQKYDSRHDGSIWFEEFCDAMSGGGISDEDLRSIYDAMDLGGSGKIRYTEFIAATIEAHGTIGEARLAEAFDHLDHDDSGFITAEDLISILGEDVPREEIEAIIAEVDLEQKDDRISYSEFMGLFENEQQPQIDENLKVLGTEMSSISVESSDSKPDESDEARAEFLKEKHLQNTLHTWALEMQLPAQEFATGCSFLHQVALGDQSILEKTLEERPALVNFRDYDRRTALHVAASEGYVDICRYLIEKGARINRSDRWGGFPLDDAHRHRRSDVINLLREYGAKFGSTSQTINLITAASEGNVEEVRTLLEFGSMDLNQGDYDRRTALHLAANEGHLEIVKLLCEAGANTNVKDRWGDRPLDDARKAKKNATEITDILTGAVAISATDRQTAIMHDLKDQSAQQPMVVSPVDEREDEGMTELSIKEFAMGCSVLHQAALGNQLVLEMIVLERPELVNFRDYDRRTALHIAASEGNVDICQYLILNGAKINRCDRWGGSPLDDAHRHRHADVVDFLRDQGAKFGSTSQATNFITAASEGDREEVQAFLDFGAVDLNQGDYDHRTALHLAAGEGCLEIVGMLCDAGADINVVDRWGHRPLDDARKAKKNSIAIMKLLSKHGAKSSKISTIIATALLSFGRSDTQ